MIEHPVPQNVTGYQFHLIGDMTIKQFMELAAGVAAAWFFWTFNVPVLLKVILAAGALLFGFALAFLPLEDRPLDMWVIAFFKAIYRPTLFTWKKTIKEDILRFKPRPPEKNGSLAAAAKAPAAGLQSLLQMYELQGRESAEQDPLEKSWRARESGLPELFAQVVVSKKLANETTFPQLINLKPAHPETRVFVHPLAPPDNASAILRGEITLAPRQPRIPTIQPPLIERTVSTKGDALPKPVEAPGLQGSIPSQQKPGALTPTAATTTNASLLPDKPTVPNVLAGMVFTADGRIVDNAIVEVRDKDGLPVRALKTNRLGQFAIATPLPRGTYELEVEKEGFSFDILKIEAKGQLMDPIEIKAKE